MTEAAAPHFEVQGDNLRMMLATSGSFEAVGYTIVPLLPSLRMVMAGIAATGEGAMLAHEQACRILEFAAVWRAMVEAGAADVSAAAEAMPL